MEAVINSILPVFALIVIGKCLHYYRFFKDDFFKQCNDLVYYIALPSFLFISAAKSSPQEALGTFKFSLVLIFSATICACVGLLLSKQFKFSKAQTATVAHVAFRGNLAYAGMPVIFLLFTAKSYSEADLALAVILILPVIIFYNVFALFLCMRGSSCKDSQSMKNVGLQIAKNPLIISSILGLICADGRVPIPNFAETTFQSLGKMSFPLVLISLGASLSFSQSRKIFKESLMVASLKCIVSPMITYGLLQFLEPNEAQLNAVMIYAACPSAVSSYIFTTRFGGWTELNSSAVVLSTIMSLPVMSVLIYIL
ncbi:AEC family transporter [Lentisphaera profundi]|uniref:AEC family transporter n=1 Tax=Lentisphaera profundi TaxID=1658616 RepID=A0ABY7VZD6_9BACT|nr:AEC family transporter [Lentisphaera profundi]WDE99301.1 AEC family transporter [Lentisphaera profundi]